MCNRLPGTTLSCFAALLKRLLVAIFVPDSAQVSQSPFSLLAWQQHKSDGKKKYIYIETNCCQPIYTFSWNSHCQRPIVYYEKNVPCRFCFYPSLQTHTDAMNRTKIERGKTLQAVEEPSILNTTLMKTPMLSAVLSTHIICVTHGKKYCLPERTSWEGEAAAMQLRRLARQDCEAWL